jgi:single-stranded DNA-binding protein
MAQIALAGTVCNSRSGAPVSTRTTESGLTFATFSVADQEYVPTRQNEEKRGQFYQVEVVGKAAEIAADRLEKGSFVAVTGQLVQRDYKDKTYYEVKNAKLTYTPRVKEAEEAPF